MAGPMIPLAENPTVAKMVSHVVRRSGAPTIMHEDLAQEAWIGVMEAAPAFDPDRNIKFKTFAERRALGSVLDAMRKSDYLSRRHRAKVKAGQAQEPIRVPVENAFSLAADMDSPEHSAICSEVKRWLDIL